MTLTSLISEEQPPHGSAVDHTEWKQAREEGTKRGEQGAPAVIDVDDSSQSDVSSCQSSHGANTHTHTCFQSGPLQHPRVPLLSEVPRAADHLGCISTHQWLHLLLSASGVEVENGARKKF